MTSPIALLLPISGAEAPAPQPTVEDPALFSAALVAALQSALIPVPTPAPTPTSAPAAQPSTPQHEGQAEVPAGDAEAGTTTSEAKSTATESAPVARGARERGQRLTAAAAVRRASTPVVTAGPRISVKEAVRLAQSGDASRIKPVQPVVPVAAIEAAAPTEAVVAEQGGAVESTTAPEAAPNRSGVSTEPKAAIPLADESATASRETLADASPEASGRKSLRAGTPNAGSADSLVAPKSVSRTPVASTGADPISNRPNPKVPTDTGRADAPVSNPPQPEQVGTASVAMPLTARFVQVATPVATPAEPDASSVDRRGASEPRALIPDSLVTSAPTGESSAPLAPDAPIAAVSMAPAAAAVTMATPAPATRGVFVDASVSSDEVSPPPASLLETSAQPNDVQTPLDRSPRPVAPNPARIKASAATVPTSAPRSASGESRGTRRKSDAADELTDTGHTPVMPSPATPAVPVMAAQPQMAIPRNSSTSAEAEEPRGESDAAQRPASEVPNTGAVAPEVPTEPMSASSGRGLAFAQELAALLGDAEITSLRVSVGPRDRAEPRTDDASQAGGPTAEPARPNAAPISLPEPAPRAVPPAGGASLGVRPAGDKAAMPRAVPSGSAAPVMDDDRLALSGGAAPVPSGAVAGPREPAIAPRTVAYQRRGAPGADVADGGKAPSDGTTRSDAVRVRVAEPAPQRAAPLAMPLDAPAAARTSAPSRAPILPASRQELPASANRGDDLSSQAARPDARDTAEPSDSENRASATLPTPTESLSRGEGRAKEVAGAEARNMPDRAETKERPAGLADRVTLQVADAEGRETRIRVTVQGDQVRAVILPSDQESARHLERRMDDLQAALVRQGFADPKVSVQSPSTTAGQVAWGTGAGGTQGDNASGRGTDQPAEDRGQGSGRQHQERGGDGQRHPQQRFRERDRDDRQNQDA